MASVPARPSPQPRRQAPDHSPPHQQPSETSPSSLRAPESYFESTTSHPSDSSAQVSVSPPRAQPSPTSDSNLPKCWICFADSSEDLPTSSPWRSPCPCALVAHEECLLDWIADVEAPTGHHPRGSALRGPSITCPSCKHEIQLARPRNSIVELTRAVERVATRAITPAAIGALGGVVWTSSMAWGIHSVYAVFGAEDGARIMAPLLDNLTRPPVEAFIGGSGADYIRALRNLVVGYVMHWRLYLGIPLITPTLVLSRTHFADSVLPALPVLFFVTQTPAPDEPFDLTHWPPSASLAFSILPYVRSAYNLYYQKVWAEKERRWLKELQPRGGQHGRANGDEDNQPNGVNRDLEPAFPDPRDDGNIFEVRIDGGIWDDGDVVADEDPGAPAPEIPQPQDPNVADHALPDLLRAEQEARADRMPELRADRRDAPAPPPPPGERRLSFSTTAIAETVLGALVFPTVCGLSGEILRLALPRSLTSPSLGGSASSRIPARGLLQHTWARSLLGGCIFVVAKDALRLYVRWTMVRMHRQRRVLNYKGPERRSNG